MSTLGPAFFVFDGIVLSFHCLVQLVTELRIIKFLRFPFEFREVKSAPLSATFDRFLQELGRFLVTDSRSFSVIERVRWFIIGSGSRRLIRISRRVLSSRD